MVLICCSFVVQAQTSVTGTVVDEAGLEVIGANVKEKGTSNGTITGVDGKFRLQVKDLQKSVLQVSFIGYESKEVKLNGQRKVNVILKEVANELQEVTVVAYGTQKKETLTGAISALNNEALVRSPNASVANTLAGQITGLSSVQTSGQPGLEDPKVYIRGVGSLSEAASSPLILVDGVERSFFQMNPTEIECDGAERCFCYGCFRGERCQRRYFGHYPQRKRGKNQDCRQLFGGHTDAYACTEDGR